MPLEGELMSLNKEMIFGLLAFGGDNMKWPIVYNDVFEQLVSKNSTYTLAKEILLRTFGYKSTNAGATLKIEFPDGQFMEHERGVGFSFEGFPLFCPAGTKFINTDTKYDDKLILRYYNISGYVDYNP